MKKIFTLLATAVVILGYTNANAQSFSVSSDTVYYTVSGSSVTNVNNNVAPASGPVTLKWSVVGTNFPADWITASGLCDNFLCYNVNTLTPSGLVKTSDSYPVTGNHDFHLQLNQGGIATPGTYYMRVKLVNPAAPDSVYSTFVVKYSTLNVQNVNSNNEELSLYPNPATNEINMVYGGVADIKTAAIYNIIGKTMAVYKVSGNNANMSLENMPAGIYFVRLADTQGQVVATRKFTKQ